MDYAYADALIPLTLLAPLAGALAVLALPKGKDALFRGVAFFWTLVTFGLSLALAAAFFRHDPSAHVLFAHKWSWIPQFGLTFGMGVDSVSLWLVLLTTFLMPVVILGSFSAVTQRHREFYFWLLVLEAAMLGTFFATDIIFFYICFEFTLIPLYFLIGIFGSTQRLKAARVFFLYTFTGSMLTFAGILYVTWFNTTLPKDMFTGAGEWSFDIQTLYGAARQMSDSQQAWVLLALLAGFAVKVPIFPFHTWLPLAHTEAPTAGSVILAGVLLKLGTYGLLRFALPMTPQAVIHFAPYIGVLAIIGIIYTALICWVQKDIKKLIAYSSVSHLGFCVLGMFALNPEGLSGSVLYMINHGLSTGAIFLCIGMIYERFHTREMSQMNGLAKVLPVWSFFMVFFCFASVGLPGLNGFVGEFLTVLGAFKSQQLLGPWYALLAGTGMILGAIYLLYMVGKVVFGPVRVPAHHDDSHGHGEAHAHHGPSDLTFREIATLVPLAIACIVLGLFPTPVIKSMEPALAKIAEPVNVALSPGVEIKVIQPSSVQSTTTESAPMSSNNSVSIESLARSAATPPVSEEARP